MRSCWERGGDPLNSVLPKPLGPISFYPFHRFAVCPLLSSPFREKGERGLRGPNEGYTNPRKRGRVGRVYPLGVSQGPIARVRLRSQPGESASFSTRVIFSGALLVRVLC